MVMPEHDVNCIMCNDTFVTKAHNSKFCGNCNKIRKKQHDKKNYLKHKEARDKKKREYFLKNKTNIDKYMSKWRENNKHRVKKYAKSYYLDNRECILNKARIKYKKELVKRQHYCKHLVALDQKKNPDKYKKVCKICGSDKNIRFHHEDYNKPLDVIPLCAKHHGEIHNGGIKK